MSKILRICLPTSAATIKARKGAKKAKAKLVSRVERMLRKRYPHSTFEDDCDEVHKSGLVAEEAETPLVCESSTVVSLLPPNEPLEPTRKELMFAKVRRPQSLARYRRFLMHHYSSSDP
jgi:hypothetical protein